MILIKPSFEILTEIDELKVLQAIEGAGRTCYKSENKITLDSAEKFVRTIIKSGHHSVIEHENISVRLICDRGVTHEIVRHRLVAYSQESTRYCNYEGGVTFVIPPWVDVEPGEYAHFLPPWVDAAAVWYGEMMRAERAYVKLIELGWSPQQARSVLPNSLKTELVMTANIREWRHILKLCTSQASHPQMRETMIPLLTELKGRLPALFEDI